jgi:hypothetical protein
MEKTNGNQYYLVPLKSRFLRIGKDTLFDALKKVNKDLAYRESNILNFLYGQDSPEFGFQPEAQKIAEAYENETKLMYEKDGFPYYIILVSNEFGLRELATEENIECLNEPFLRTLSISGEEIVDFFVDNGHYSEQVEKFFELYHNVKPKKTSIFQKIKSKF